MRRAWMRALRAIGSTLRRIRIGMSEVRGTKLEARYASELDAITVATGDTGRYRWVKAQACAKIQINF